MKYCVLIIDGAAGLPLPAHGDKTCLELARTPNLDIMTTEGWLGLARTVPPGMEPSSACACMSVLGYDPVKYYRGRASIEARSMGINVGEGEVVFRCNLVTVRDGMMYDYSAGHIGSDEARAIITSLNEELGDGDVTFYSGVGYRHILKLKGHEEALGAVCTPPHDIPGKDVADFMPHGEGSTILLDLMTRSENLLRSHEINVTRRKRGDVPVTIIWLFWGSGQVPKVPAFRDAYGIKAAMTSGVDLLRGLAMMADIDVLDIDGVTDGPDSNHTAQIEGALTALERHDLVAVHIEAPDEAGHAGIIDEKVEAIRKIDEEVVQHLRTWRGDDLRVLIMPDHPTPIEKRTHTDTPVPFLVWGKGVKGNGAVRFTEAEAGKTGVFVEKGYTIMEGLVGR